MVHIVIFNLDWSRVVSPTWKSKLGVLQVEIQFRNADQENVPLNGSHLVFFLLKILVLKGPTASEPNLVKIGM